RSQADLAQLHINLSTRSMIGSRIESPVFKNYFITCLSGSLSNNMHDHEITLFRRAFLRYDIFDVQCPPLY
ncbi:hypothetical protein M378DRAFT_168627, partial [Amanita muscaria Koide BX008]